MENITKRWFSVALLLILSISCWVPLMGQDQGSTRGNLGGTVLDKTEAVVAGATVTITGPIGSLTKLTNDQGDFLFPTLIPGFYSVKVEKPGFKIANVTNVEVLINKTTNIRVIIEPGTVTETVEVVATAISVENTSAAVTADLTDTVYKNLPLGRGVASIFYLSPGVTSGLGTGAANPSISGATGLENLYVADGITMNDPAFGGLGVFSRVYGPLGSGINLSFVKEVQVKTAGFEPQYGHSTGGIVQIVTKSGGTETHGVIGGFFQPPRMSSVYKNNDDFQPTNLVGRELHLGSYEGDFELGGYVPLGKLKDHLFYFGTFNPSWNTEQVSPATVSALHKLSSQLDRKTTIYDYAAKLTLKINDRNSIESTVSGDPAHTNTTPFNTLNVENTTANSKWELGSRNWAVRYNGTLGADWLVNGAFTYNWNHFSETPISPDVYEITDLTQTASGQRGLFRAQGIGLYEPYDSNSKGIEFDTSKGYHFGGKHTFSFGYTYSRPSYDDVTNRSGLRFAIPTTNATGGTYMSAGTQAIAGGQMDNATFSLNIAPGSCTLCPTMNIPDSTGNLIPQPVYLRQTRGTFSDPTTHSTGRYHAGFVEDSWEMGRHATLNLGLRWEQQRLTGNQFTNVLNDQWSPRISFVVDPKGDRKSKIYASFGRYAYILPLDLALRSLSSESDLYGLRLAPASSGGVVTLNSLGTVTPVLDAAHVLNKATGGINRGATFSGQGTPLLPGTKMEYNDEFVVGAEHEFRGGIVASARYIDRRLKRIIEDFGGVPIEGNDAGQGQFYGIGNISAATDFSINANEVVFSKGAPATSLPAACVDKNGQPTPFSVLDETDTFGTILGSACFPAVNMNPWTSFNPKCTAGTPPTCPAGQSPWLVNPAALFGGEAGSDGKPDGFNDPKREYQAVEFEVNKPLSHNWAILANWRIARLQGNYEGAFRNDNNQGDPGISSLFDFTPGLLGLLGFQQSIGILNSDRKHVLNVYTTYVLDRSVLKGLVLGSGVRVQTGVPLTTIAAQDAYVNSGEVPIFGRGDLGRAPVTGTVDSHIEYPWKLHGSETKTLKFGIDLFNIGNTKRNLLVNQFVDLQFGVPSTDFKKPGNGTTHGYPSTLVGGFVAPFSARISVSFNF
jgi:hypothetical protein